MGANSFGSRFVMTSFGESHGNALGVVIDGCPAGVDFDEDLLLRELARRRPGRHGSKININTNRKEEDKPEILSGVFQGKTIGTPIAIIVKNTGMRSKDYDKIAQSPRRGHADQVWKSKFGHVDHRGGGRSSGRETLSRVIAGAVAQMIINRVCPETKVLGYAQNIGPILLSSQEELEFQKQIRSGKLLHCDDFVAKLPCAKKSEEIQELLLKAKKQGKSYGGVACLWIKKPPSDLGQPVFHKLKSDLTAALMSVGATSGVEMGAGFSAAQAEGSQFHAQGEAQYGGIQGGISTGDDIFVRVAFKPTASVLDVAKEGRHDPCIVPRAIPVLEAMARMVLVDHYLWKLADTIEGAL